MRPRAALILAVPLVLLAGIVAVAAEWSLPAVTVSQEGVPAMTPTVVVDGAGVATALWEPDVGGGVEGPIRSSRFTNGEWSAPANASAGGSLVTAPSAAVDASGIVTAAWTRVEGSERILQAARYSGSGWGAAVNLSTPGGNAGAQDVVVDASGVATVVWERQVGSTTTIQAARFANGAWGPTVDIATANTNGGAAYPQAAVDGAGVVTAVWMASISGGLAIQSARFASGAWGGPSSISPTGAGAFAFQPQVVAAPTGTVTAVWHTVVSSVYEAHYATFSGGTWTASAIIPGSPAGSIYPKPAVDSSGVVTVAWEATVGGVDEVQAARLSGGTWSTPVSISAPGQDSDIVSVAAGPAGTAVAAFRQSDGANTRIASSRYSGGLWSDPQVLSPAGGDATRPELAVDDKGNATVVWQRVSSGFDINVQAAQYFTVPSPPRRLVATPGNGSAEIAWTAPASDAGSPITGYAVSVSPGGHRCAPTPPTTRCAFPGLTNGTAYTFTITASNALGTSWASTATATPRVPDSGAGGSGAGGTGATAPLTATITTSRRTVASGGRITAGIRVRNTGPATATKVVACIKVPKGLAIVQKPRGKKLRNPACFTVKSLKVGKAVTRKVSLRATATKRVKRTITGTARAKGIARVKATPRKVTVTPAR